MHRKESRPVQMQPARNTVAGKSAAWRLQTLLINRNPCVAITKTPTVTVGSSGNASLHQGTTLQAGLHAKVMHLTIVNSQKALMPLRRPAPKPTKLVSGKARSLSHGNGERVGGEGSSVTDQVMLRISQKMTRRNFSTYRGQSILCLSKHYI